MTMPVIPSATLHQPITLRDGIGVAHDRATSVDEAQRFYDQGLSYLHNFSWIEAARSFNQALKADPALALAYSGLSIAYTELNLAAPARDAIRRAVDLSARSSEHERWHVRVRERQFAAENAPGDSEKILGYRAAADEAVRRFPMDVEFLLQRGVAEARDPADRGQGSLATSIPFFEKALALAPDSFAAHHYLTHALENSGRFQDALAHAEKYAALAPSVPHARHMHGHDLRRLGQIDRAIAEFEEADHLHRTIIRTEGLKPEYDWDFEHNLDLLAASYQFVGQTQNAERAHREAFDLPTFILVQAVQKRHWPQFLYERGRLDEALAAARVLIGHANPVVRSAGHVEAGRALLRKGQVAEAIRETQLALAEIKAAAAGGGLTALSLEQLQGELLLRRGERDKAHSILEATIRKARALTGPDEWSDALFALDSICWTARDAGDWDFAERMARQLIEHDPMYGGGHYALALAADHKGDQPRARAEFTLAEKYWSRGDRDFSELASVRKWLMDHGK
jgi:tetratricopeptide (TPR) repeat protein